MDITTSTWTELLQQFFPIFTAPGAEIFSQLMIGWILCTVRRTVTGILPFANPTALGRRTSGLAYQHAIAPKKWSDLDRVGCADDQRSSSMVAGKAVSGGRRRILRHSGGKR